MKNSNERKLVETTKKMGTMIEFGRENLLCSSIYID